MKQYELAIGLRGEGNTPGALQALYRAIELDSENSKAHLLLATFFLLERDDNPPHHDAEAEKHFREALRIQESEQARPESIIASDARNGLGVLYIHQQRYDEAIVELKAAVADLFNRQTFMAWGNLGWAYYEKGDYKAAVDALERSVKQHPRFCVGFFRLGRTLLKTESFERAEEALTRALEVDQRCESFQDAWHLRGEARMKLGNREDARGDFERCVELDAKNEAGQACTRYLEATF
ncbi:MAG: tetratricopeptide repeat protein [Myxococcales bacterium]|nr:tetratricopeptide repeat protein [Myxococcales bacterium]